MAFALFYDTETCGIPNKSLPDDDPMQPPLVQLGALLIDLDNDAEFATLELIVRPNGKYRIPDAATKVNGITTDLAEAVGVPLSLVIPMFVNLRARASLVVGFNVDFDQTIMRQAIARNGKPVTLTGPDQIECAMIMSTPWCEIPASEKAIKAGYAINGFKPPKLTEAYKFFFGEDFQGAHGALADTRATAKIYFEILRRRAKRALDKEMGRS